MNKFSKSAILVACAGMAVSACSSGSHGASGDGGNNVSTAGVLAGAYQKVLDVHSADINMDINVSTANGTNEHITATGAMQWQPLLGSLSISIPLGQQGTTTLDYRLLGDNMYIQVPQALSGQTGGKSWIEGSLSSLVGSGQETSFNPADTMALLASQATSITKVGPQTVNGVDTTEYTANLDLSKAVSSVTGSSGALQKMIPALQQMLGSNTLPVQVWVDGQGRLVQFQLNMTLSHPPTSASTSDSSAASAEAAAFPIKESITESLSNYGVAVNVTAPPASDTMQIDLGSLIGQSGL